MNNELEKARAEVARLEKIEVDRIRNETLDEPNVFTNCDRENFTNMLRNWFDREDRKKIEERLDALEAGQDSRKITMPTMPVMESWDAVVATDGDKTVVAIDPAGTIERDKLVCDLGMEFAKRLNEAAFKDTTPQWERDIFGIVRPISERTNPPRTGSTLHVKHPGSEMIEAALERRDARHDADRATIDQLMRDVETLRDTLAMIQTRVEGLDIDNLDLMLGKRWVLEPNEPTKFGLPIRYFSDNFDDKAVPGFIYTDGKGEFTQVFETPYLARELAEKVGGEVSESREAMGNRVGLGRIEAWVVRWNEGGAE